MTRNPRTHALGSFPLRGPLYVAGAVALLYPCALLPLAVFLDVVETVGVAVMLSLRAAGIFSTTIEAILYGKPHVSTLRQYEEKHEINLN